MVGFGGCKVPADRGYVERGDADGQEIGSDATIAVVKVVEGILHGFGIGFHPTRSGYRVALCEGLFFEPFGVHRFEVGCTDGVVFDYYGPRDAHQGE